MTAEAALGGRVLVIVYGHVADTMAAIPGLRSLRRARPEARLEVLCLRSVAPLLADCPYIDELVVWDDFKRKSGRAAKAEKAAVLAVLTARLRSRRYDAALVFHRSFGALRVLARATGAATVAGVSYGGRDGYTHPAAAAAGVESSRDENRRVLEAVGVQEDGLGVELWTTVSESERARTLIASQGSGPGPVIGLHAGSDWSCQQWLPERFADVASGLRAMTGATLVSTGSAAEVALEAEIAERLDFELVRCAGQTSLRELVAVIRRLDLLVCVNSAAAAIAQAVGTPAVVLLGPEDARLTGLESSRTVRVVQSEPVAPGSWCEFGRWGLLSGCESPMCRGIGGLDSVPAARVVSLALELIESESRIPSGLPHNLSA
ncbi:MAG: glycosyltransferase family 9 protein [Candidatus Dormibacteraeota bacterium]|nr:glycosyltransferase family 9 protein [Candidatus Dormibacteraeota bacterium]